MKKYLIGGLFTFGAFVYTTEFAMAQMVVQGSNVMTIQGVEVSVVKSQAGHPTDGLKFISAGTSNGPAISMEKSTGGASATVRVKDGNIYNESGSTGFTSTSVGNVILDGAAQRIEGTDPVADATSFPTLELTGTSTKTLVGANAIVTDKLLLGEAKLIVNGQDMMVTNFDPEAVSTGQQGVVVTTGDKPTDTKGSFTRALKAGATVNYPFGVLEGTNVIRKTLRANSAVDTKVKAQHLNNDINSASEQVKREDVSGSVESVTDRFYHTAENMDAGSDITYSVIFNENEPAVDGSISPSLTYFTGLAVADRDVAGGKEWALPEQNSISKNPELGETTASNTLRRNVGDRELLALAIPGQEIEIPSAITPNDDGTNDRFVIKGLHRYPNNELVIFNRWGNTVFEAKNYQAQPGTGGAEAGSIDQPTNGTEWNGAGLNEGTYFYVLKVGVNKGKNDQSFTKKGYVTLLRPEKGDNTATAVN